MLTNKLYKTAVCSTIWAALLSTSTSYASTEIEYPAQQPLSLIEGISPNVLLTLDDSGSMNRGYTPDAISSIRSKRYAKSSFYNAQYYNPEVVYRVPKKVTLEGGEVKVVDYPTPNFKSALVNGFNTSSSKTDLSKKFRAQWNGSTSWTGSNDRAHYYEFTCKDSSGNPDISKKTTERCYTKVTISGAAQETNFAIWYSFYRDRLLATKSAANLAFYKLPESMRFTWGDLPNSGCNIGANQQKRGDKNCYGNKIDQFKGQHKANFYKWLDAYSASGVTPLHLAMQRAGDLMKKTTSYTRDTAKNPYSCQANYHVLMTDGMWNQRPSSSSLVGNADNSSINNSGRLIYNPNADYARPYADSNNDTLADLAFYYWATDLLPGTENNIQPRILAPNDDATEEFWDPRNNPATWQHMVNYVVGLGLSNSLTNSLAPTWHGDHPSPTFANLDELKNLRKNGKSWPSVEDNNANKVYDLWHAAINSRGEFFSADSPDSLVAAFENILLSIGSGSTVGASQCHQVKRCSSITRSAG